MVEDQVVQFILGEHAALQILWQLARLIGLKVCAPLPSGIIPFKPSEIRPHLQIGFKRFVQDSDQKAGTISTTAEFETSAILSRVSALK